MLRRNTTLEHLKLKRNDLRDDGADLIAAALGGNATLQSLSLAQNGVRSVPSLPDALRENATLESLDLGDNAIGDRPRAYSSHKTLQLKMFKSGLLS